MKKLVNYEMNSKFNSIFLNGIRFDGVDYNQASSFIEDFLIKNKLHLYKKGYIVTPHAEFLEKALIDEKFKNIINNSILSVADGISVLWLENFFSMQLNNGINKYLKISIFLESLISLVKTFLYHGKFNMIIKYRVIGTDLLNYIFTIASKHSLSIYFLGGFDNVPQKSAEFVKKNFSNVKIAGYYGGSPRVQDEYDIIEKVLAAHPDILVVAYNSIIEEEWIGRNLPRLNITLAIGVGRGLDYITGKRKRVPRWIQNFGLEWLFKGITDKSRIKRQLVFFRLIKKAIEVKYKFNK